MKNASQYEALHQANSGYGSGLLLHLPYLAPLLTLMGVESIVNYGCGKSNLSETLKEFGIKKADNYDPAIPEYNQLPAGPYDCVITTDVLEHIPEDELPGAISNFKRLSSTAIHIPHLEKARFTLPNGENAHCTIKTASEWKRFFEGHYQYVVEVPHHSEIHATLVCSDEKIESEKLHNLAKLIRLVRIEFSMKNFASSKPFRKRLGTALRLLAGKSAFRNKRY
jgi:hypothetical protein